VRREQEQTSQRDDVPTLGLPGAVRGSDTAAWLLRETALDRFKALIGLRESLVVATEHRDLDVPLFMLAAPPVLGAKVAYSELVSNHLDPSWSISAPGSGTGARRSLTASASSEFTAADGDRQLIFLPVTYEVAEIEVRSNGKTIGPAARESS